MGGELGGLPRLQWGGAPRAWDDGGVGLSPQRRLEACQLPPLHFAVFGVDRDRPRDPRRPPRVAESGGRVSWALGLR